MKNPLLEAIKQNKPSLGMGTNNPHEVELLAKLGFDWFWMDQMFTDNDWKEVQVMLWAAEAAGISPVLRLQSHPWVGYNHQLAVDLSRAQGIGAQFVMMSYSDNKEVEEALVVARDWHRKALTVHQFDSLDWDAKIDAIAANQAYVIPLAETKDTIEKIEETMSLPGVKMFYISMTDGSKVITGDKKPDFNNPKLWKYVEKISECAQKYGVYVGANTSYAYTVDEISDRVARLVDAGIKMIMIQHTAFFMQVAMTPFINGLHKRLKM